MIGTLLARFFQLFSTQPPQQGALVQVKQEAEQGGSVITQPMKETEDKPVKNGGADSDGATPAPAISQWHLLTTGKFFPTPNQGGKINPRYLVIHFTANGSVSGTVKWFQKQGSEASAHVIIGRDGQVVQMVAFDRRAWHAGQSRWRGLTDLNSHSIGIELVNWGKLTYRNGRLYSWAQQEVEESDAERLTDKDGKEGWWQRFTVEQLEVCFNLCREIVQHYRLEDVLGHFEVSPGRKIDPGPAFPLAELRAFCMAERAEFRNKDGKVIALRDKDGK
jgi:N-acetyl-anhydromuramyl-L-alanine amidase AmpD